MRRRPSPKSDNEAEISWQDEPEIRFSDQGQLASGQALNPRSPRRTGQARGRLRAGLVVVVVLVAVVIVWAQRGSPARHAVVASSPQPSTPTSVPPSAGAELAFQAGNGGHPVDLALSPEAFYVLFDTPPGLLASNRVGPGVSVTTVGLPDGARLLANDEDAGRLWVVGSDDHSVAQAFIPGTLKPVGQPIRLPTTVTQVAAANNTLWLATPAGLYYVRGLGAAKLVPGISGAVEAVSIDPSLGLDSQVIAAVASKAGEDVLAIDSSSAAVVKRGHLPLVNVTLAATAAGIWFAGDGESGGGGEFGKFADGTLIPAPQLTVGHHDDEPGITIWAGTSVVWVSSADGLMTCVSAENGAILQTWPDLTGPVVSDPEYLAALGFVSVGVNSVRLLTTPGRCSG